MSVKYWIYLLGFLFIAFFASCSLTDNEKPVPTYIFIDDPKVLQKDASGFDTDKITDIWVFVDGQILGVYPLPAKIPILASESAKQYTFLAGIRNSGMNDTPVFYPFYKSIEKSIVPTAGKDIVLDLVFDYVPTSKASINESFETGNSLDLDFDNNPSTNLIINSTEASLGLKSGEAQLTNEVKYFEIGSDRAIRDGENARGASYIEFDYKGEGEIAVGIAKNKGGAYYTEYVLFVPGKNVWNKIYVDVTDKCSPTDYYDYRLVFKFTKTGNSAVSKLFIDNVKHVHF